MSSEKSSLVGLATLSSMVYFRLHGLINLKHKLALTPVLSASLGSLLCFRRISETIVGAMMAGTANFHSGYSKPETGNSKLEKNATATHWTRVSTFEFGFSSPTIDPRGRGSEQSSPVLVGAWSRCVTNGMEDRIPLLPYCWDKRAAL
jgi:hypothetical protein